MMHLHKKNCENGKQESNTQREDKVNTTFWFFPSHAGAFEEKAGNYLDSVSGLKVSISTQTQALPLKPTPK